MDRKSLLHQLTNYKTVYPEEALFVPRFRSLLTNFPDCYKRSMRTGHMTGSAWIINEHADAVLWCIIKSSIDGCNLVAMPMAMKISYMYLPEKPEKKPV